VIYESFSLLGRTTKLDKEGSVLATVRCEGMKTAVLKTKKIDFKVQRAKSAAFVLWERKNNGRR